MTKEYEKQFSLTMNVGKVKYFVKYHDGISKNNDGSAFFGGACFSNKIKLNKYMKSLEKEGYVNRTGMIDLEKQTPELAVA